VSIVRSRYNDPALGETFANIASMFAPPTAGDTVNYAQAREINQKADIIEKLKSDPRYSGADAGVLANLFDPVNSWAAQEQNNATSRANNLQNNQFGLLGKRIGPVSEDAMLPAVPADIASMFGVGHALPQIDGLRSPLSETEAKGGMLEGLDLTPEEQRALGLSGVNTTNVVDPVTQKPKVVYENQAVGMEPAAASPLVTVNSGENAYDKVVNEGYGKSDIAVQQDATAAQGTLNTVAVMRDLMSRDNFYSGPVADQIQAAKAIGASLGFTLPDASSSMEAFNALSNQLIIDAAGGSLGNQISNGDVKFLQGAKPNMGMTPAGNNLLLDITEKIARRKMEVAQWAEEYKATHEGRLDGNWIAFQKQKAEAAPLFPPVEIPPSGALPDGVTEEDIQHTMQLHNLSRDEVLKRIGGANAP
jgi:hypothetical protein